ncbi:hypothetical protein TCAL_10169, partial [Tigriopus californicus]
VAPFIQGQEVVLDSIPLGEARFHGEVQECDPEFCWKNCRCQSEKNPGDLDISDLPQFVLINFQGEIDENNLALIHLLMSDTLGRNRVTQCPIRGTIFAQGVDADYMLLNHLYNAGNEIGSLGLSSHPEHEPYTWKRWQEELVFHRRIISLMANINFEDVRMARSPWMDPQGDQMLSGLDTEKNPNYNMADASFTSFLPTWPYTLDFMGVDEECLHPPCRTKAFKGMWELPMYAFETLDGNPCLFVDECPLDEESSQYPLRDFLMKTFRSESYYGGSRYPFIMNFKNISFLEDPHHFRQIFDLLQAVQLPDVHVVTMSELLEWTQNPMRLDELVGMRSDRCSGNSSQVTACRGKACYYLHDHKHIRSLNCLGKLNKLEQANEKLMSDNDDLRGRIAYLEKQSELCKKLTTDAVKETFSEGGHSHSQKLRENANQKYCDRFVTIKEVTDIQERLFNLTFPGIRELDEGGQFKKRAKDRSEALRVAKIAGLDSDQL